MQFDLKNYVYFDGVMYGLGVINAPSNLQAYLLSAGYKPIKAQEKPVTGETVSSQDYSTMTRAELMKLARAKGIKVSMKMTKDDLLKVL